MDLMMDHALLEAVTNDQSEHVAISLNAYINPLAERLDRVGEINCATAELHHALPEFYLKW